MDLIKKFLYLLRLSPQKISAKNRLTFLFSDVIIFGTANAINKSMALITLPLIARSMSPSQYGSYELAMSIAIFASIFLMYGQDSAVSRLFYDAETNHDRQITISSSVSLQLAVILILAPIFWYFLSKFLSHELFPDHREIVIIIIVVQASFLMLMNFSLNVLRWSYERGGYLLVSLGFSIFQGSLIVGLFFNEKISILSLLYMFTFTTIAGAALGFFFIRKWLVLPSVLVYYKELIGYAIPTGTVAVAVVLLPIIERIFVAEKFGLYTLGLYAIALKASMILAMFQVAFQSAWGPFAISTFKKEKSEIVFNQIAVIFSSIFCFLLMIIALFAQPLILFLAGDNFLEAETLVVPICLCLCIGGIGSILQLGIGIAKKPKFLMISHFFGMVVTLLLLFPLSHTFGLSGVPFAVLIGTIIRVLVASYFAQRLFPINWDYRKITVFVVFSMLALLIANLLLGHAGLFFYRATCCFSALTFLTVSILQVRKFSMNNRRLVSS